MQHDREAGQPSADLLENVEAELRLLAGLKLVRAVAGADGDGQRVDAGLGHELLDLRRVGVGSVGGGDVDRVLDAGESAQLALDDDASGVRVVDDLLGQRDIVLERVVAAVDHNRGEAAVDAGLAELERVAVVEVDADGQPGVLNGGFDELHQINMLGVVARARGNLQDQRRVFLHRRFGDALNDLHIVDVERADGVAALIRFFEHFRGCNKWHNKYLLLMILFQTLLFYQHFPLLSIALPQGAR